MPDIIHMLTPSFLRYAGQMLSHGDRFISGNVIVRLTRIYRPPEGHGDIEPLDAPNLPFTDYKLIDPSGCYVAEACIRVSDPTKADVVAAAQKELEQFKQLTSSVIGWIVPERQSLDSRVKNQGS
jgi:mediator of RNA polymerase II transcription subunit 18, fungi type